MSIICGIINWTITSTIMCPATVTSIRTICTGSLLFLKIILCCCITSFMFIVRLRNIISSLCLFPNSCLCSIGWIPDSSLVNAISTSYITGRSKITNNIFFTSTGAKYPLQGQLLLSSIHLQYQIQYLVL